jgi:hypothetical protein
MDARRKDFMAKEGMSREAQRQGTTMTLRKLSKVSLRV